MKMVYGAICILCLMVLAACASNMIRITEYRGATLPVPGMNAAAGGCQISQEGALTGRLIYIGERCQFDSLPTDK